MRFKRHGKNKLRWINGTTREAESVVEIPTEKSFGSNGNPRYRGVVAGVRVWVVVAKDDPNLVITVFWKERR
ncbi:MAG: hypothetical protein ACRDPE_15455 [Solirubrobacterales bacterium]